MTEGIDINALYNMIPAKFTKKFEAGFSMYDAASLATGSPKLMLKIAMMEGLPEYLKTEVSTNFATLFAAACAKPDKITPERLEEWKEVKANQKYLGTDNWQMLQILERVLGDRLKTEGIDMGGLYGSIPTKYTPAFEKEYDRYDEVAQETRNPKLILKIAKMNGISETLKMYISGSMATLIGYAVVKADEIPDAVVAQWKEVFANKKLFAKDSIAVMLSGLESMLADRIKALAKQDSKKLLVKKLHTDSKKEDKTRKRTVVVR